MKAIEVLLWMDRYSVSGEAINIDEITEDMDFKAYYGYEPVERPAPGRYLRVYSSGEVPKRKQEPDGLRRFRSRWVPVEPDCTIVTDYTNYGNGGVEMIYLYKLED